jgi:hypothetical protein
MNDEKYMKVEIETDKIGDLVEWLVENTENRGQGVALLLATYMTICIKFEPRMSEETAVAVGVHALKTFNSRNNKELQ